MRLYVTNQKFYYSSHDHTFIASTLLKVASKLQLCVYLHSDSLCRIPKLSKISRSGILRHVGICTKSIFVEWDLPTPNHAISIRNHVKGRSLRNDSQLTCTHRNSAYLLITIIAPAWPISKDSNQNLCTEHLTEQNDTWCSLSDQRPQITVPICTRLQTS